MAGTGTSLCQHTVKHIFGNNFIAIGNLGKNRPNKILPIFYFHLMFIEWHTYKSMNVPKIKMPRKAFPIKLPNFDAADIVCFTSCGTCWYQLASAYLFQVTDIGGISWQQHISMDTCRYQLALMQISSHINTSTCFYGHI